MSDPILALRGITKHFGGVTALRDISFEVEKGAVVGLMGPNGAGKTTLLNVIAGEYAPDEGGVNFKGRDITGLPAHKICHLGIGRTYQIPQPFVSLTIRENLLVSAVFGRGLKKTAASNEMEDEGIYDLVDLRDKRDAVAGSLPILSLKKLELARALARKPDLLLMDEIAAGATEREIPRILETIRRVHEMGVTILIIEHVMRVLVNAVDKIVVVDKGVKICEDAPGAVMCDKKVMEAYFGA